MRCNSCGAENSSDATRCTRCHIRFAPAAPYQQSAALRQPDYVESDDSAGSRNAPAARQFGVISNPVPSRSSVPTQSDLFSYAPQGKVVALRGYGAAPADWPQRQARPRAEAPAARTEDPLYAADRQAPRRRPTAGQSSFDFPTPPPPPRRPFTNELKPVNWLPAAPLKVRFYSLLIDALVVLVLSIMFGAAVFVSFRASGETLTFGDLTGMPLYLPVLIPVALSLGYKALWAVFEHPTIGLQSFGLDVISMDGHRPTVGQRMVRVFAGWLTIGGMIGALWAVVNQERYSMQDMISQTFLTQAD